MNKLKLVTAAALFFATTAMASAQYFWDGNKLHEQCTQDKIAAIHYVLGAADEFSTNMYIASDEYKIVKRLQQVCIPKGATSGQLVDIVCKSLSDEPENRHWAASKIVSSALTKAFPCQ